MVAEHWSTENCFKKISDFPVLKFSLSLRFFVCSFFLFFFFFLVEKKNNRSDEIGFLLMLLCHPKVDLQQLPEESSRD